MQPAQLDALAAVVDHGTFEAAARHLHVTPSAVSQRVRALETSVGQVLVRRTTPCRPTEAGRTLLRVARQTRLLLDEARTVLDGEAAPARLSVAVNADSLATWFREVVGAAASWPGVALRVAVEDQAYSADLLRDGEVLAAVTSDPTPVQGCTVEPLGTLRYIPAAAPDLVARWRRGRSLDWARMPIVTFNDKDSLQHELLEQQGRTPSTVVHQVPTSWDFLDAVRRGLGWSVIPEAQLDPELAAGTLVRLHARSHIDVPLHWQRWRLDTPALARLSAAVHEAARSHLRR